MNNDICVDRRVCDEGRRWGDQSRSCFMLAYFIFTVYGVALGFLVGYMVAKYWG